MSTPFEEHIERLRIKAHDSIARVPIAVLIWGPAPSSGAMLSRVRVILRDKLNNLGHHARFSEELIDPLSPYSIITQQMTHVEAFDLVLSIPDSPGSIAEIHDFARIPHLAYKIVAFLDQDWNNGYSNQSLLQLESTVTCQIQLYDNAELPDCICDKTLEIIRRLQEYHYLNGRRF